MIAPSDPEFGTGWYYIGVDGHDGMGQRYLEFAVVVTTLPLRRPKATEKTTLRGQLSARIRRLRDDREARSQLQTGVQHAKAAKAKHARRLEEQAQAVRDRMARASKGNTKEGAVLVTEQDADDDVRVEAEVLLAGRVVIDNGEGTEDAKDEWEEQEEEGGESAKQIDQAHLCESKH